MPFTFTTRGVSITEIPTDTHQFVKDANDFVDQIVPKWKKIKTYNYKLDNGIKSPVTTYGSTINDEYWLARASNHSADVLPFETFQKYLIGTDEQGQVQDNYAHTNYEVNHSKTLDRWEPIRLDEFDGYESIQDKEHLTNWIGQKVFYELGAPLTTREFNEFMLIVPVKESPIANTSFVIQLVADKEVDSGNVRGIYVSIERLRLLDDGSTEWTMCTSSDSGGSVPKWLQNSMISKSVSGDVCGFINWVNTL